MTNRFRTQAEYYLRLAELADGPEDKARLMSMACSWHRLAQELDLCQPKPPQDAADRCAA